jgi:hypothetical protein
MLKVLFTLDYEIHGNGEGDPYALMVEPTERMMRQFEQFGAKLTILADIGEILRFKQYAEETGCDDFRYHAIAEQLRTAVQRGHDVQLHIHASYFNARYEDGHWRQDWSEYDFAGLKLERLREVIRRGKEFLESLLRPVAPDYRCFVFRAANWSVSPSANVVRALVENGIRIDTSVFKYGRRAGLVNFDYTGAWSNLVPWRANARNLCQPDEQGELFEFPIYSEQRWLGAFLTPQRVYRALLSRKHKVAMSNGHAMNHTPRTWSRRLKRLCNPGRLTRRHAWKADFNQCTGMQLVGALARAAAAHEAVGCDLPFVLIGHSKLFTRFNERSLRPFLAYVAGRPGRFGFGRYGDFDLQKVPASSVDMAAPAPQAFV